MTEIRKYLLRFGITLALAVPLMLFMDGANALKVIGYKITMVALAVAMAELLWVAFFKPAFGKTELLHADDLMAILVFRGVFYAAIVLAMSLGL